MKQQTAFAVACGITAFLLVGGSAVVTSWRTDATAASVAEVPSAQSATAARQPTSASDAAAQERAVFLAREAVYRQRLAEANRRLIAASATISADRTSAGAPSEVSTDSSTPAPQPKLQRASQPRPRAQRIDAARAGEIALAAGMASGAGKIQRSELVLFQGVKAYEIVLTNGVVYVDAGSGAVLFSAWAPPPAPPPSADNLVAAAPAPASDAPPAPAADAPPAEAPPTVNEDEQNDSHEEEVGEQQEDHHEDEQGEHQEDHSEDNDD